MAMTTKHKRATTKACAEYPQDGKSAGMVHELLLDIRSYSEWYGRSSGGSGTQIHHLYSRSSNTELNNYRCNLSRIWQVDHIYCHDVNKFHVEFCCLLASWRLHVQHLTNVQLGIEEPLPVHQLFWHVETLDAICKRHSLKGRIQVDLIPAIKDTPLIEHSYELLYAAENDDLPW